MTLSLPPVLQRGLLAGLTSLLFAGSFIAGKYTTFEIGPLTTSLFRYTIASAVLGLLVARSTQGTLTLARRDWLPAGLMGSFGVLGYHAFFFASLNHTAIANTAIINAFNPVVTGVLAVIVLGERLARRQYLGVAIALAGVLVLLSQGGTGGAIALGLNLGDGLMLCAVLCWAIYSLLVKRLSQRYSGLTLTFYAAIAGVAQLLIAASTEHWWQHLTTLSVTAWLALLYMGIAASGIGYLLFNLSIQRIGPTRTASVVYGCVPLWVALLAFLFFQQPVTLAMGASMGLTLVGLRLVLHTKTLGSSPQPPNALSQQ